MITVGIIDYYVSEWHACHFPENFDKVRGMVGIDCQIKYAYAEEYVSPVDGRNTDEWCRDFGVTRCESIDELCEKCDAILILAPSDPQTHLKYAREAFKWGKPTFIDKTFVDNYAEAEEVFTLAERYGTKFFSASSFRFAEEIEHYKNAKNLVVYGNYTNYPEYAVHYLEMVVAATGAKPLALKAEVQGEHLFINVRLDGGKDAMMVITHSTPAAFATDEDGEYRYHEVKSDFSAALACEVAKFFESGIIPFDTNETLYIMKARDAALKAVAEPNVWHDVY